MLPLESLVVRFMARYSKMSEDERAGPDIEAEVRRMKQAIEKALRSNYYFALTYAIDLGKISKDPTFTKTCVQEAYNICAVTTEDLDIDELNPIFQEYLGVEM